MKFSIIVVSLNAGNELCRTVETILRQTYKEIEIIIKDGGSTDGSIEKLPIDERILIVSQKDYGIYDGMNQGMSFATGDFVLFMNCGDGFYNEYVLEDCVDFVNRRDRENTIFYGDCYTVNRESIVRYPDFSDYLCFSMVLCHQATFYPANLVKKRKFDTKYKIAADYEYYVHAYKHGIPLFHLPIIVAMYQGDGTSETVKNRRLALEERKKILKENYNRKEYRKTLIKTRLHGVGIKQFLVKQEWFYPFYKKVAELYYRKNSTK